MKILGALLAHDNRINTLKETIKTARSVKYLNDLEIFCFDTEKETTRMGRKLKLKLNMYTRPIPDKKKITCSYWNIGTGMREAELMQLAYLRNKVLEEANRDGYDYLYFIDSDLIIPEGAIEKLLLTEADIALGWYFHKRLGGITLSWNNDNDIKNRNIIDTIVGGNGGVLFNKRVVKNVRYELYNGIEPEDLIFYDKARKQGFSVRGNLGLHYQHLGYDWKPKAIQFAKEKSEIWKLKTPLFK